MSPAEHQIEDTIEQAANPLAGEQVEETGAWAPPTTPQEPAPFEEPAPEPEAETPAEPEPQPEAEPEEKKDDDDSDWRTWSGRSVNP